MVDLGASSSLTVTTDLYNTETWLHYCLLPIARARVAMRGRTPGEAGESRELAFSASSELFLMQKRVGTPMSRACMEYAMSSAFVFTRES